MTKKIDLSKYLDQDSLDYFSQADGIPERMATAVIKAFEETFSQADWQRMLDQTTADGELDMVRKMLKITDQVMDELVTT